MLILFEENALLSFKKLIRNLGDSNITSKEWNKSNYSVFDAIVQGTRLNFNFFFTTGVTINTKNSSRHVFFVSKKYVKKIIKEYARVFNKKRHASFSLMILE